VSGGNEQPRVNGRTGAAIVAVIVAVVATPIVLWVMFDPLRGFMSEPGNSNAAMVISNATGEQVLVEAFADNQEWIRRPGGAIQPQGQATLDSVYLPEDESRVQRDGCTFVALRALDAAGREIERREPPLCQGDTWVIDGRAEPNEPVPSSDG